MGRRFFYSYLTNRFMTTAELSRAEEVVFVALYEVSARSGRPMYKGDYDYHPDRGLIRRGR